MGALCRQGKEGGSIRYRKYYVEERRGEATSVGNKEDDSSRGECLVSHLLSSSVTQVEPDRGILKSTTATPGDGEV